MLARGRGSIINVSSMNARSRSPQRLAYCVSKAGVNTLTKVPAIEWTLARLRGNAIAPGYVESEMVRDLVARGILERSALARRTLLGRLGTPAEIGEAAASWRATTRRSLPVKC